MRKLSIAFLGVVLAVSLSACKCSPAVKQSASEIENSQKLVDTMLIQYMDADRTLTPPERKRRDTILQTNQENIRKLKKALED